MKRITKRALACLGIVLICYSSTVHAQGPLKPICKEGGELIIEALKTALEKWTYRKVAAESAENFTEKLFQHPFTHLADHFKTVAGKSAMHSVFTITEREFAELTQKSLAEVVAVLEKKSVAELEALATKGKPFLLEGGKKATLLLQKNPLKPKDAALVLRVEAEKVVGYLPNAVTKRPFTSVTYLIKSAVGKTFGQIVTSYPAPVIAGAVIAFVPIKLLPGNTEEARYDQFLAKYPTMINRLTDICNEVILSMAEESVRYKAEFHDINQGSESSAAWWEYVVGFMFEVVADPFVGLDGGGLSTNMPVRLDHADYSVKTCYPENAKATQELSTWLHDMGIVGDAADRLRKDLWEKVIQPGIKASLAVEFNEDFKEISFR